MAKLKNRDKRKAVAQRKANQASAGKVIFYDGYMVIPLDPSLSDTQTRDRCQIIKKKKKKTVIKDVFG